MIIRHDRTGFVFEAVVRGRHVYVPLDDGREPELIDGYGLTVLSAHPHEVRIGGPWLSCVRAYREAQAARPSAPEHQLHRAEATSPTDEDRPVLSDDAVARRAVRGEASHILRWCLTFPVDQSQSENLPVCNP